MPSAALALEWIGQDAHAQMEFYRRLLNNGVAGLGDGVVGRCPRRAWVARIVGPDARYGWCREFIRGKIDYSEANSKGSRGVMLHYVLKPGEVYEVNAPSSWRRNDRYFCRVSDSGEIVRISQEEVQQWLNAHSEPPY